MMNGILRTPHLLILLLQLAIIGACLVLAPWLVGSTNPDV